MLKSTFFPTEEHSYLFAVLKQKPVPSSRMRWYIAGTWKTAIKNFIQNFPKGLSQLNRIYSLGHMFVKQTEQIKLKGTKMNIL